MEQPDYKCCDSYSPKKETQLVDIIIGEVLENDQSALLDDRLMEFLEDEVFLFTEDAVSANNCPITMSMGSLNIDHSLPEKCHLDVTKSTETQITPEFESIQLQQTTREEYLKTCAKKRRIASRSLVTSSTEHKSEFNCFGNKAPSCTVIMSDGASMYQCPFSGCSYKARRLRTIVRHMSLHQEGQRLNFKCDVCGGCFYTSGCLTSHMVAHRRRGETNYNCKVKGCGKCYTTREGLRLHKANHHLAVSKTWVCMSKTCAMSFVRKSDLQMHILRMHAREMPYPCPTNGCMKKFPSRSELRRHMLKLHNVTCLKLLNGVTALSRPKSEELVRLLNLASLHRDNLRRAQAEAKAIVVREHKASSKALCAEDRRRRKRKPNAK